METLDAGLRNNLLKVLDPFGVWSSCWEVQQAWARHPGSLAKETVDLCADALRVQQHAWRQLLGQGNGDVVSPAARDERFRDPIWTDNPHLDTLKEYYLLYTRWLEDRIFETPGVPEKTRKKAAFWVRQAINATAPTNFFWTNPAALVRALETGGRSVLEGLNQFMEDVQRGTVRMVEEDAFAVGQNLATTPGAVVLRNELVEVLQYAPTTETTYQIPILFVPPWINKYYILDLDERKSMIRYLVSQGFTVFTISWKNPQEAMRGTTLDDYMLNGVLPAVEAARQITGAPQVHLSGYCIGGTIAAAVMAWLNRQPGGGRRKSPVAHWSVLTTLVDFAEPGDVEVFISESGVAALERKMAAAGYLDGKDMSMTFRMLRSNSLIWNDYVRNYLYGEKPPSMDVLYWNMDTTRMPEAMHSFYLRKFYLENRLIEKDGVELGGRPIDLGRIKQPLYAVGTEQDHIAPWKSTFRLCGLVKSPVRYVLATSGHILGIISPPVDPPKRRYWAGDATGHEDPDGWQAATEKVPGSWWEDWVRWLGARCGKLQPPPALGSEEHPVLAEAPGTYVLER